MSTSEDGSDLLLFQKKNKIKFSTPYLDSVWKMLSIEYKQALYWFRSLKIENKLC